MSDLLAEIVCVKQRELAAGEERISLNELEKQAFNTRLPQGFHATLKRPGPMHIIAEVKKASPSAGVIRQDFEPVSIARTYASHGASCISVLTDQCFFQGDLEYLSQIRNAVSLPLLRKDFLIHRRQLLEARLAGADAVLLIAEILPGAHLSQMFCDATELGFDVLVEFHDEQELPRVLDCGATLIGINNRDLRTFETRREKTFELLEKIPKTHTVVSESGIRIHQDLVELSAVGVRAVLVGESLMRADDIGNALDRLRGTPTRG